MGCGAARAPVEPMHPAPLYIVEFSSWPTTCCTRPLRVYAAFSLLQLHRAPPTEPSRCPPSHRRGISAAHPPESPPLWLGKIARMSPHDLQRHRRTGE